MTILKNSETQAEVVILMVPFTAQGHLNQLLHLSRLLSSYNLPVHFITTTTHVRQAKVRLHGCDPLSTSTIHFHEVQTPNVPSPPPNPNATTKFPSHLLPCFKSSSLVHEPFVGLLSNLSKTAKRVIVIYDSLMNPVVEDVTLFPNAEAYMFVACSAFTVFWNKWEYMGRPDLDIRNNEIQKDIPSLDGCFCSESIEFMKSRFPSPIYSGMLYDSSRVIEGEYLDLVAKSEEIGGNGNGKSKTWAVGPFNPVKMTTNNRHKCLEWLDKQETNSILYVSFGTTISLGDKQILEMAKGLEASGVKFIWVLRDADRGDIFDGEVRQVELPKGYEERLKGKGIVERGWVPQSEILEHRATGGFMSHCGWNSCMESITMGVPIAAWPMHSDQPRNAVLITSALKVGLPVIDWAARDELVSALKIEQVVRRLMVSEEGDEIRTRAAELGGGVRQSMAAGGVSRLELDSFVAHIIR